MQNSDICVQRLASKGGENSANLQIKNLTLRLTAMPPSPLSAPQRGGRIELFFKMIPLFTK